MQDYSYIQSPVKFLNDLFWNEVEGPGPLTKTNFLSARAHQLE